MQEVYGEYDEDLDIFLVMFEDDNGRSILAKVKTEEECDKLIAKYEKDLEQGKLLKEHKSVFAE